ncbi:hypothetical protein SAY86_018552 [Trapa natans]|uniref:SBP-type domain-containing protein n=1 Tax=Trapa natans TaxID=22666 RepID=A0AAN7LH31_TRANT|nr:hypothetical protein SAY86_018552 [Trapa natans]
MTSVSVMEWNSKHPLQWEWENQVESGAKAAENIKMGQPTEWKIEAEEGTESGSLYLYRDACPIADGSGRSSFDPGYAWGSKSASMNSSSTEEMKFSKFPAGACKVYPDNFSSKNVLAGASPPTFESVCSHEPVLSLKLGKRSYFEDMSDRSNPTPSNFPSVVASPDASAKRIKSNGQNMPAPYCQVEGCNIDLSTAKDYHRKHRVCKNHSKSAKVVVNGVERRFCQQCSRFHGLSEFDENKRSCRKRLSDHNARRRKPHPDVSHFSQARLSTSIYGGLHPMNSFNSGVPFEHTKSSFNLTWSNTSNLNFTQAKGNTSKLGKSGIVDGNPYMHHSNNLLNNMTRPVTMVPDGSHELLPLRGCPTFKILDGGSEESPISLSGVDVSQGFHGALSLLSTVSQDSCRQPKPVLYDSNSTSIPKPWINYSAPQNLSLPMGSTEHWNMEQWPSNSLRHNVTLPQNSGNSNCFGSIQPPDCLIEDQHEFGFEPTLLNFELYIPRYVALSLSFFACFMESSWHGMICS